MKSWEQEEGVRPVTKMVCASVEDWRGSSILFQKKRERNRDQRRKMKAGHLGSLNSRSVRV